MEWSKIFNLRAWTSLSEIEGDVEQVMDGVYRVGPNAYVRTQPHNRNFEAGDPRSPFVTKAYWAPSVDALKRSILGDPSLGTIASPVELPAELAFGTSGLYSELTKQVPKAGEKIAERAIYSNKGAFLYRLINIGRLNYCFLSNEDEGEERAFLIAISLIK